MLPLLAMVVVQIGYAGMNILSKLAMDSGMNPFVFVAYRQLFATFAVMPFAFFFEWRTRPKLTKQIFSKSFCALFSGKATMNQTLYFAGLKITTPTISCALTNLLPALTYILAITFRLEKAGFRTKPEQAKVIGTVVCVGGAMLLTFYHGGVIHLPETSIYLHYAKDTTLVNHSSHKPNFLLGSFMLIGSSFGWASWFIVQARLSRTFNAPYTSSALMCFMATIESAIIAVGFEHNVAAWSLRSGLRLGTTIYAAILCSALSFCLISWTIQRKGPLYVSVFSPLLLVLVAILSWALLREKLYVGTLIGSILIICGLYIVLWGKSKETKESNFTDENKEKQDLEMQQQPSI